MVEMQNSRISLDGSWQFLHVIEDYRNRPVQWRSIEVPGPWQAQFSDLRTRGGTGLYRRQIKIPSEWKHNRVFIHFGAVFHVSRVWVNGALVGSHVGGFLPFSFDITDHVEAGDNELKVRVDSPSDDPSLFPDTPFAEIPFGKQSWYGPLSGIWQSVYIESRCADHIQNLRLIPDICEKKITLTVSFALPLLSNSELRVVISQSDEKGVATSAHPLSAGQKEATIALSVTEPWLWSPNHPNLYRVSAKLHRNGLVIDASEDSCGFRKIEARDGRFYLNDKPFYLRAALDQDYYPDTICTTPSVEFLEDQFRKAKYLGLNCIRCHIKAPDPRYYEVADRLGILIWTELPNMGATTERARARKEETLKGIVDRDGNHPSIICWTIINENWGVDLVHDADDRAWLRKTYRWLKQYDTTRLVVDNSPLWPSFHIETDIADYHYYAALPDSRADWDHFVDELATRPAWLFSDVEGSPTGDEPIVCSEFGNWGIPDPALLSDPSGNEPWWFETGHDWADGVMYPHGVQNRFSDWSLARVFGSLSEFAHAAQWQQFRALKYAIETMRARSQIAGYVITELTDAHWECNGLLDMRRNPRVFYEVMRTVNADTIIVPRWSRLSYWGGDAARLEILIANGGSSNLAAGIISIMMDGEPVLERGTPFVAAGEVLSLGEVEIALPHVPASVQRCLELTLKDRTGIVTRNSVHFALHASRPSVANSRAIWTSDILIAEHLTALGYTVVPEPQADALWICTEKLDGADHVRRGGRMLLLPESDCDLTPFFPHWQNVRVLERRGTLWRGDWASSFSWLRRGHAFARLPGGPLLDEAFDRVLPLRVIAGCNLLDFQARVHAALVLGWIHKSVALALERGYGRGRVVVSTFRLFRDPPLSDPTATTLLDALIALALAEGSAASREQQEIFADLI
jgi:hypothetical protein